MKVFGPQDKRPGILHHLMNVAARFERDPQKVYVWATIKLALFNCSACRQHAVARLNHAVANDRMRRCYSLP
jgi:uncharacterized protein YllA (UPF0747 family)